MTVKAILNEKGRAVLTAAPDETLGDAVNVLAEHKVGALVVTNGDGRIVGILSERDVVRAIAKDGPGVLGQPLKSIMTAKVRVCNEHNTVNDVMAIMTEGRFRHLPVEKDGRLDGIISIGDVVKRRIEDVEREAEEIRTYIATA